MEKKIEKIIFSNKPLEKYIAAVLYAFEYSEVVELSAIGTNINRMERVVSLFCLFDDVAELDRRRELLKMRDGAEFDVIVCTLARGVADAK